MAICILAIGNLKAQTYTTGHIHIVAVDSMSNDSTNCIAWDYLKYNVTVDSSYTGETLNFVDTTIGALLFGSPYVNTTGASPWSFSVAGSAHGMVDAQLIGGYAHFHSYIPVWKVTCGLDTMRYLVNHDTFLVPNPCMYDTISGHVYIDNNTNCIQDVGDIGLSQILPDLNDSVSSPGGHVGYTYVGSMGYNGYYNYLVQKSWMVDYTVSLPPYYAFIFPYSPCFTSTIYTFALLPQGNVDFPLLCSSNVDVQCNAMAPGMVRLHKPFYMQPYVSNTGCDSASGQLHFIKDHRVIYDPSLSIYPADTVHGDTLIWNYSNLSNLSGMGYWNSFLSDIYLTPDLTVVVGDTLCFSGYSNIPSTDINPANNSFSFCIPVVYSYDPNLKEVSPAGTGPQGYIPNGHDTLTYTLHFQNTGTAAAENIKIIDTLDSHINAKSLKILGSSHNMSPKWLSPRIVEFDFNNINLPDSGANFAASQGQVRFSVALNNGLPVGTQIKNTGYIYFDANPAVKTNTTLNTIHTPSGVNQITTNTGVIVYPNPATDQLFAENLNGGEISVLNISGAELIRQNVSGSKATIDISQLPGGVYILRVLSNNDAATVKFTKY